MEVVLGCRFPGSDDDYGSACRSLSHDRFQVQSEDSELDQVQVVHVEPHALVESSHVEDMMDVSSQQRLMADRFRPAAKIGVGKPAYSIEQLVQFMMLCLGSSSVG